MCLAIFLQAQVEWMTAIQIRITLQKTCHSKITYTQLFNSRLSGTTWVSQYQKKHLPTHTHPDHQTSFINFLHLL